MQLLDKLQCFPPQIDRFTSTAKLRGVRQQSTPPAIQPIANSPKTGWLRAIAHPQLPQTRTCPH